MGSAARPPAMGWRVEWDTGRVAQGIELEFGDEGPPITDISHDPDSYLWDNDGLEDAYSLAYDAFHSGYDAGDSDSVGQSRRTRSGF